jgi:single-strand DNA-binding protein
MNSSITVSGNLTRDAELKFTDQGLARVNFGIASTRKVKDRETTSFYDVVAFGKTAENIHASLTKGSGILVTGRLEVRQYEKKDGTKGTAVEIVADEVGALLRFATVSIQKNERIGSSVYAGAPSAPSNNLESEYEEF